MKKVRVAALDLGKARVGVAVADELGMMAHARPALDGSNKKKLLESLKALAKENELERFLVGLPLEMTGQEGPAAKRARELAFDIAEATGLEIELVDERLTTVEAHRQLRASGKNAKKSKGQIDGVAAAVLLQSWLDRR